ncbi:winged helix-turn-helix domain-containing protein [Klebsiella oxytoca]|uniref:winged helix-turn-helix domain-containing protein n=1 Tax=Klebsiella oxytoca TaxID=571 RepID=UPI00387A3665
MRYLINELIVYDEKLKTLSNKNFFDDPIKLSPGSVAVLLDFFISYPHTVWNKADIGEKAFAESSYSGSESNVNKSLSLLRRSFKDVGEDSNIITTLPSQGVVFNGNVTPYDEVSVTPIPARQTTFGKKHSLLLAFILAVLITIPAWYYFTTSSASKCSFLNRGNPDAYALAIKNIKQLRNCKAPGIIINGINEENEFKKNHSLVAMCDQSSNSCLNFIKK